MKYRIRRAKERTSLSMRYPIFSHTANPAIDKPLIRKKLHYVEELVSLRQAYWIDAEQKHLGVVLRAKLLSRDPYELAQKRIAGSGFDSAWHILQSGEAGPLVWQLRASSLS